MTMNLYLISQDVNDDYDTYISAVVTAATEEEAKRIHPRNLLWDEEGGYWYSRNPDGTVWVRGCSNWAHPNHVKAICIGTSNGKMNGVICASYNAG